MKVWSFSAALLFYLFLPMPAAAEPGIDPQSLLKQVAAAYGRVNDYRVRIEASTFDKKGGVETKKFLYTFQKPNRIRLDFESPHAGLTLVYPDPEGKVGIRPLPWVPFLKLRLAPGNALLLDSSGQRVDQTDLGSLIKHIEHSLTNQRREPAVITTENGRFRIQVLADDPFRPGTVALYRFFIDPTLYLPVQVEVSTAEGRLERKITFENLSINTGVADGFFRLE